MKEDNLNLAGRLNVGRDNLGSLLKEAREAKGMSTEGIAERLKVRPSLLENIEAGRFEELPELIYTRAYIQKYAQLVGLAPEPFTTAYERIAGSIHPTRAVIEPAPRQQSNTPILTYALAFLGLVLIGVLAFILAGGGFKLPNLGTRQSPQPKPTQTNSPTNNPTNQMSGMVRLSISSIPSGATVQLDKYNLGTTPLKDALVDSRPNRELRVFKAGYKPYTTTRDLVSNSNLSVTLERLPGAATTVANDKVVLIFRGSSWARVRDKNGKELYQGTPAAGTKLEFNPPIEVRLGAPSLVSAVINGQTRERLGGSSPTTIRLP
ncbi:MAG: RodZ domain-containing protein [Deinococcales bacterium]